MLGGRPDREGDDRKDDRREPPGDRGLGCDVTGRRHPLQPEGEDEDEDEGDEEAGDGRADERADLDGAVDRAPPGCGKHSENRADDRGDQDGADGERQRDRQAARERLRDRLAGEPGAAHVSPEGAARPVEELHDDRPVEAELVRFAGDDRGVGGVADDAAGGVARAEVQEVEAEHTDREHGQHTCSQAAEDESQHRRVSRTGPGLPAPCAILPDYSVGRMFHRYGTALPT